MDSAFNLQRFDQPPRVHTILQGPPGAGKAHAVRELLQAWFGPLEFGLTSLDLGKGAPVMIEMSSRHYGFSSSSCVRTMGPKLREVNPRQLRAVVFYDAQELSYDVQCALRLLTDLLPNHTFVFVTTDVNKLMKPIQSRCVTLRVPLMSAEQVASIVRASGGDPTLCDGERRVHLALVKSKPCRKPTQTVSGLYREMAQYLLSHRKNHGAAKEVASRCSFKLVRDLGLVDLDVVRGLALAIAAADSEHLHLAHTTIVTFSATDRKCEYAWFVVYQTVLKLAEQL